MLKEKHDYYFSLIKNRPNNLRRCVDLRNLLVHAYANFLISQIHVLIKRFFSLEYRDTHKFIFYSNYLQGQPKVIIQKTSAINNLHIATVFL